MARPKKDETVEVEKKKVEPGLGLTHRTYELELLTPIMGTAPRDKDIYTKFIKSRLDTNGDQKKEAAVDSETDTLPTEPGPVTCFHRDAAGLLLYDYQVKGFIKEAGDVLKDYAQVRGLRNKIERFLFVTPRFIHFEPAIQEATGVLERPIRITTMHGQQLVALAASEYIDAGAKLNVTLSLIPNKDLNWDVVSACLEYGALKGLGQWRNGGYGRIKWTRL